MTEKQPEFSFMKKNINNVEVLGYIGGQDEDLGGYCEPLIIEYFDGIKEYILHEMHQCREGDVWNFFHGNPKIINIHNKVLFSNESRLIKAWEDVRVRLSIDLNMPWEKTDNVCGCDTTPEEFYETKRTKRKTLEKAL